MTNSEKPKPNFDAALKRQRAILNTEAYWGIGRRVIHGPAACEYPEPTLTSPENQEATTDSDIGARVVTMVTNPDGTWDIVFDPAK